jgi:ribosomal protein S18 acetylase RimI-like enzyme
VHPLLDNPVYNALVSGDAAFAHGSDRAKYFDEAVSPFAGFPSDNDNGFGELHRLLPAGRRILYAKPEPVDVPTGWKLKAHIAGLQFVFEDAKFEATPTMQPLPLNDSHIEEMVSLAALTKPGPFNHRTIDFGSYYGFFEDGRLAAMTGQRLHVFNYTEVSAVCTHPDFLGKGYATKLLEHQLGIICKAGEIPFLHVREDNSRAIAVYERLGFRRNRPMHFYFLERI